MKERGRRITLKADISDLQGKFRTARSEVNSLTKDLRSINRGLKFDTSNVTSLTTKQNALNNKINKTVEIVKNLRSQINAFEKLGEKTNADKVRAELAKWEGELKKAREEAEKVKATLKDMAYNNSINKFNSEIDQARSNIEKMNTALKNSPKNLEASRIKLTEMGKEFTLLSNKAEFLQKELKKIDMKLNPSDFNKVRNELVATKAEAEKLSNSMKELGNQHFNIAKRGIEDINSSIRQARENADAFGRALKFDSFNSDLKASRFKELSRAIELSKEKTELLKRELRDIDVNIDTAEFSRLNAELAKAETQTKQLLGQMSMLERGRFGGLATAFDVPTSSIKKLGAAMQDVGRTATYGLTLPAVYGASRMVGSFRETDDSLRRTAAAALESGENFETALNDMYTTTRNMSQGTIYSMRGVSDGMEFLVKAGWNASDAGKQVAHVLNLAKVEGMELGRASEIVVDGLSAFGLKANETQRFVDVLTKASVESTTGITEFGETLKYVAPTASALGFSIEDVSTAIAIMAGNGIKASIAGTTLRAGFANMTAGGAGVKKALDSIGFSLVDNQGKTKSLSTVIAELREKTKHMTEEQKTQFATMAFGKTAMSGWLALLNASDESVAHLTNSIKNSSGVTKEMADNLSGGIGGAIDRFTARVSNASAILGKNLEPTINGVLDTLGDLIEGFSDMDRETQVFVASLVGITVAMPPLVWAIGSVVSSFGKLKAAMMWFKANPVVLASATFFTGMLALTSYMAKQTEGYKQLKASQEAYANSSSKFSATMDSLTSKTGEFNQRIQQSSTLYERLYGSSDRVGNRLIEISNEMGQVQQNIDDITALHTKNREALTAGEIATLDGLMQKMNKLTEEQLQLHQQRSQQLHKAAVAFAQNDKLTSEQIAQQRAFLTKTLKQNYDEQTAAANEWYTRELADNESRVGSERKTTEQINEEYQKRLNNIETQFNATMEVMSGANKKAVEFQNEFFKKTYDANQKVEEEQKRHEEALKYINEEAQGKYEDKLRYIEMENKKHETNMNNHRAALQEVFNGMNQDSIAMWVNELATQKQHTGEITMEQAKFAQEFLRAMDNMPADMQEKFRQMFEAAGLKIDELKPMVEKKMKESGQKAIDGVTGGIKEKSGEPVDATQEVMNRANDIVAGTTFNPSASKVMQSAADGFFSKEATNVNAVKSIMNKSKNQVDSTNLHGSGSKVMQTLQDGINTKKESIPQSVKNTVEDGKSRAGGVRFDSVGSGMMSGIEGGIHSRARGLADYAAGVALNIFNAMKSVLGINSPSRLFRDGIGQWIPPGMAVGIDKKKKVVIDSLGSLANESINTMKKYDLGSVISENINYSLGTNMSIEHSVRQNDVVVNTLNQVVERLNNLEFRSDVYMDSVKVGEITYAEHEKIERRFNW